MEDIYKRDCVNIDLVLIDKCPHSKLGYCINCSDYIPKIKRGELTKRQVEINNYFNKIIMDLGDAIIDEAMGVVYQKYRHYPNIQTIRLARMRLRR